LLIQLLLCFGFVSLALFTELRRRAHRAA
jgi:hypothetical protein